MLVLGIAAFYHDSAAAIVRDGAIIAGAQEERFTRRKDEARFPKHAIRYCLREAGLRSVDELDVVCFYDSPWLKFERILQTFMEYAPAGYERFRQTMPLWVNRKLWVTSIIREALQWQGPILWCSHHESHAASAFLPSPFDAATIVTVDGVGEWTTAAWGHGAGNHLTMQQEVRFPHSLGLV
jgi:carbamoyltransferase